MVFLDVTKQHNGLQFWDAEIVALVCKNEGYWAGFVCADICYWVDLALGCPPPSHQI